MPNFKGVKKIYSPPCVWKEDELEKNMYKELS